MIGALNPQLWWWVARSTGIVAWVMATASIAWGLTLSGRLVRRRKLPAWLLDLHRYLATLTVAFIALHLVALVADGWTHFGWRELFIPFASTWRPRAVLWGIVAFYGVLIVQVTSWGMRRLPRQVWHGIHLTSYLVFVAATMHFALAGADRMNRIVQAVGVAGVTVVISLTVLRVLDRRTVDAPAPSASPAPAPALAFPPPTLADRVPEPAAPIEMPLETPLDPELTARLARLGNRVRSYSG